MTAGWNSGKRLAPTSATNIAAVDTEGYRFAVKQTIGAIGLTAQYTQQKALGVTGVVTADDTDPAKEGNTSPKTAVLKATVIGLRADYMFSKTASVYAGYEQFKTGAEYNATAPLTTGTRTLTSIGLRKVF